MFGKTKDPVCGMKVTKKTVPATSQHMGKTFHFCSVACKEKSDQDPMKYMKMEEEKGVHSANVNFASEKAYVEFDPRMISNKVPIHEFADRVTSYFVPTILIVAAMAFSSGSVVTLENCGVSTWLKCDPMSSQPESLLRRRLSMQAYCQSHRLFWAWCQLSNGQKGLTVKIFWL